MSEDKMHHFVKVGLLWSILSCQFLSALEKNQANSSSTIDLYPVYQPSDLPENSVLAEIN